MSNVGVKLEKKIDVFETMENTVYSKTYDYIIYVLSATKISVSFGAMVKIFEILFLWFRIRFFAEIYFTNLRQNLEKNVSKKIMRS